MDHATQSNKEPPPGWKIIRRIRQSSGTKKGREDKFYYEPGNKKPFRSLKSAWEQYRKSLYQEEQNQGVPLKEMNLVVDSEILDLSQHTPYQIQSSGFHVLTTWSPPPSFHFKINFDVICFNEDLVICVGVVIRNEDGDFFAGLSKKIIGLASTKEGEAIAAFEACQFANDGCFSSCDVILEGSSTIIPSISQANENLPHMVDIRNEIRKIKSVKFSVVNHMGNKVANSLARHARFVPDFRAWLEDAPEFLMPDLLADISK